MSESIIVDNQLLALDSHVHLYDWVNLVHMLDAARTSFAQAVAQYKNNIPHYGMLVLTEPATRNTFGKLREQVAQDDSCPLNRHWSLEATDEPLSLVVTHTSGTRIFLLSGQQIVTRENLEVLSLCTEPTITDRQSLAATITEIQTRQAFPLIPWGVGKWLGSRGKTVSQYIDDNNGQPFGLGDNGGRPSFWKHVAQFNHAKIKNIATLRGSDPLPVDGSRRQAGSFGTLISCSFDLSTPAASLVNALRDNNYERIDFGQLESPLAFLRDQIALRLR